MATSSNNGKFVELKISIEDEYFLENRAVLLRPTKGFRGEGIRIAMQFLDISGFENFARRLLLSQK